MASLGSSTRALSRADNIAQELWIETDETDIEDVDITLADFLHLARLKMVISLRRRRFLMSDKSALIAYRFLGKH